MDLTSAASAQLYQRKREDEKKRKYGERSGSGLRQSEKGGFCPQSDECVAFNKHEQLAHRGHRLADKIN